MIRKILTAITFGSLVMAATSYAAINVNWVAQDGFLRNTDDVGIMNPAGSGLTAWVQLIFTPLNNYGQAGLGGTVEFDEVILDTYELTDAGGTDEYGNFSETYSGAFVPGFIYGRVFDGGTGSDPANQIVNGTWYYNGPLVATIDNVTPETPDVYNVNGANTSPTFGFGDTLNLQVPEPSVLAFFGIGGLALAIRRRIKA